MSDSVSDWRLPELPDLRALGVREVFHDLESTGLRWWRGDRMIGGSLLWGDRAAYFPIRHRVGPNIPEETYLRWAREQLRGVRVVNIRTKFDLHLYRQEGIDLDAQGCTFGDVAHYAALLDDHRVRFNQRELAEDLLGDDVGKVEAVGRFALDPTRFADYPAGLVAVRAIHDTETVRRLQAHMWPLLDAEDLQRVRELEDQVIPAVVEMEENGAPIDQELLGRWCAETQRELEEGLFRLTHLTGVSFPTPDNRDAAVRMFQARGLRLPMDEAGAVSFADVLLEAYPDEAVQTLRNVKHLFSLRSKFLLKYQKATAGIGILRYELHQLPFEKEEGKPGLVGAVTGRFSSAAPAEGDGANIQQVFGGRQKRKEAIRKYPVRKLFMQFEYPWFAADASQIEYRMFGDKARSRAIIDAYRNDPDTDYHELVGQLIKEFTGRELLREETKAINFAQVYGAGVRKLARQLGVPTAEIPEQGQPMDEGGPKFLEVVKLSKTYHRLFPEVKPLLALAQHVAMPGHVPSFGKACTVDCSAFTRRGIPHRGYIKTILGRRRRFAARDRHYSALNASIQGSAADWNKRVIVEVHRARHELGLVPFFTVHDEFDGVSKDPSQISRIKEVFNAQYYPLAVPIIWEMGMGRTWADAKEKENRV